MLTYLNIGLVVQLILIVERNLRSPNLLKDLCESCEHWYWWIFGFAGIVIGMAINVTLWPAAIVCEIITIKNGD